MGAGLVGIDAVCMALLAVSASRWEGTPAAGKVDSAVMLLQLFALCGERMDVGGFTLETPPEADRLSRERRSRRRCPSF